MAQRRYGPTLGAGVVVIEQEGDKPIAPAQLGVTGYAGIMERGPLSKIFLASKKKDFLGRAGSIIPESLLPDAALDFYDLGNGAGELWLKRLTDGSHLTASFILKSRHRPIRRDVLKIEAGYQGEVNPGRWAGRKKTLVKEYTAVGTNTLTTGVAMPVNIYEGAILKLNAVAGKSYKVVSNDAAGILTFASDVDLTADLGGSVDALYVLELENEGRALSVEVINGQDNPTSEFGLIFYVNGTEVKRYKNLSMDSSSSNYVVRIMNDDSGNFTSKVEMLFTGTLTEDARPANWYGDVETITETVLTTLIHEIQNSTVGDTVGDLTALTLGGSIKKDVLTLTVTDDSTPGSAIFSVASALQGALPDLTEDVAYVTNQFLANFTLTNTGGDDFANGDVVTLVFDPLIANSLVGGVLTPDTQNNRRVRFEIVGNTVDTITVKTGSDMTAVSAPADEWKVESPIELEGGYDGIEAVDDADYLAAWDSSDSQFNSLFGKNKGLVKLATPGVTSTAVQKAGLAYAESRNYQYRVEVPSNIVTEEAAEAYINEIIGRNDFGKVHWPSYAYITNREGAGLKLVSLTGSFHGREALVAKNYDGYHKIAGGIEVTLPNVIKLPTGEKVLDQEITNPAGINLVVNNKGNFVMWGARSISIDPAFRFVQKREQLSHYENIFRENFDFIIFALNNEDTRSRLETTFVAFFLPEFAKGAIVGDSFDQAVSIKIDEENNPAEEIAAGNLNAEIKLRLADTVERFIITIGQAGIFEDLAA